jgi:hypothetical protein
MRRRLAATLPLIAVVATTSAGAAMDPLQQRAREVRSAIPAAEAYYADHGTYAGMTLAKVRRAYDRSLRNIAFRKATKRRYCVESTMRPFVHYDGPGGPLRRARCGVRGAPVPSPGSTPAPEPTTPEQRLRAAVPAIEAYAADHGGYAGMTIEALLRWDAGLSDIRIVWATRDQYCIESGSGSELYHRLGPAEGAAPGPCPAAPNA